MPLKDCFTTREAAHLGGFKTAMMVDYLYRTGIVVPSKRWAPGRGRKRLYGFGDILVLRAVSKLLSRGLPVARLKVALNKLRSDFKAVAPETAITRFLVTNGTDVYFRDTADSLVELTGSGQMAFAFLVDIEATRREIIELAKASPERYMTAK